MRLVQASRSGCKGLIQETGPADRMGAEENRELVRRQFELLNAGDTRGAAALWGPESYNHGGPVNPLVMSKVYESLRSLHESHTLHEMLAEGEWVAVRTTCQGIHAAEPVVPVNGGIFSGLKPTGRRYTAQHIHLFRIAAGRIVEHWANRDDLGVARQVGLELRPSNESSD